MSQGGAEQVRAARARDGLRKSMQYRPNPIVHALALPAAGGDIPSVMAFSMAKAGSTLLYDMLRNLSRHAGLTYFSIEDKLFADNQSPTHRPTAIGNIFREKGYCYGGFRQFPAFPVPILWSSRIVFLVRDPRDMITSLYFSLLSSHAIPPAGTPGGVREQMLAERERLSRLGINEWAPEQVRSYVRMFEGYVAQGFHWRPNVAIYRYEDVIHRKREWLSDIAAWFSWDVEQDVINAIAESLDINPERERPDEHVRQVSPGNHAVHLTPATIAAINEGLREYMRLFGYLD